ncbi:hypothetical protein [Nocardioides jensenii]|uniref:hypothetical protein n=1 Tax=Nocardioides jensenii TaxID=1843 RepID=UPI000833797A|nr:hypothetical protein [Nocardioides jensenii]
MLVLSLAITLCVVAWGYLVYAAIDFGSTARGGESRAWGFLALACVGAAACLFAGMILVGRLLRAAGIITDPASMPTQVPRLVSNIPAPLQEADGHATNGHETGWPAATEQTAPLPVVPAARQQGGKRAAR